MFIFIINHTCICLVTATKYQVYYTKLCISVHYLIVVISLVFSWLMRFIYPYFPILMAPTNQITKFGWWDRFGIHVHDLCGTIPDRRTIPTITRAALNAEIPSATKISIWHNMVVLWNSHTVKQSRWWFCLIEIKHYSSRGPITLWLCVLHMHWCRDCETVPEQDWNKARGCFTVSMHTATMQTNKFWN